MCGCSTCSRPSRGSPQPRTPSFSRSWPIGPRPPSGSSRSAAAPLASLPPSPSAQGSRRCSSRCWGPAGSSGPAPSPRWLRRSSPWCCCRRRCLRGTSISGRGWCGQSPSPGSSSCRTALGTRGCSAPLLQWGFFHCCRRLARRPSRCSTPRRGCTSASRKSPRSARTCSASWAPAASSGRRWASRACGGSAPARCGSTRWHWSPTCCTCWATWCCGLPGCCS
mmetsp:Transcript_63392/g.200270  ORF Transcript_63392/g.200270 Transcript_63392/m.200270 type:complete len:223 (-) Transcript_63392:473-1141(-)